MAKITIKKFNESKVKCRIFHNDVEFENESDILLQEQSYIILRKKSIFEKKIVLILYWIFYIIFWIFFAIIHSLSSVRELPSVKNISQPTIFKISYQKVLSTEISIWIGKTAIDILGLEVENVLYNGEAIINSIELEDGSTRFFTNK